MSVQTFRFSWKTVKFGEVVRNANLTERDPAGTGIDRIVGLEHLDPENLHIRRWNALGDGTSFTRKFVPEQTLFGKRRAYQRKVAFAEFEGICSGDVLTFESKNPEKLLPELLPFICQTDAFFDYALGTSAGSLSPRTSWKALQNFEFPLPSIEEQKRIAEILWAADNAYEQHRKSLSDLVSAKRTLLTRLTTRGVREGATQHTKLGDIANGWQVVTVDEVTSLCQYGLSVPLHESGRYPILRMMNYDDGRISANELKYVDLCDADFSTFKVRKGDVLFNRTNSADLVGKVGIFDLEGDFVFASYLVRLRADEERVLSDYLNFYLNSDMGQRRLLAYATPGVSQTNISAGNLRRVLVPVPPLEEQKEIVHILNEVESSKALMKQHTQKAKSTLVSLINGLLTRNEDYDVGRV